MPKLSGLFNDRFAVMRRMKKDRGKYKKKKEKKGQKADSENKEKAPVWRLFSNASGLRYFVVKETKALLP